MFKKIFKHKILQTNESVEVIGLNKGVQASYVWNLFRVSNKSLIVVTNTLFEANSLYKLLSFYTTESVLFFPMDDFLVSEALAISPDLMSKRIETLNELATKNNKNIIITNLLGYLRFLPSKELSKKLQIFLSRTQTIERDELVNRLNMIGYEKNSIVTKTGEYANRGYILDIFPYGAEEPIRIEFFDNEL